jgi:MraZ protein
VGLGQKFQLWEPARFRAHLEEARAKVRDLKKALGTRNPVTGGVNTSPGARER